MWCYGIWIENPYRSEHTHRDDYWYCFSDVGKKFYGRALTMQEYVRVETLYVETAKRLLGHAASSCFRVSSVEERASEDANLHFRTVVAEIARCAEAESLVLPERFSDCFRAVLRGYTWCGFNWEDGTRLRKFHDLHTAIESHYCLQDPMKVDHKSYIITGVPPEIRVQIVQRDWYFGDDGIED